MPKFQSPQLRKSLILNRNLFVVGTMICRLRVQQISHFDTEYKFKYSTTGADMIL